MDSYIKYLIFVGLFVTIITIILFFVTCIIILIQKAIGLQNLILVPILDY